MNDTLGKQAEAKIEQWLDVPEAGYCFDRLKDQMSGLWGSKNICDFTVLYLLICGILKAKLLGKIDLIFSMITDYQRENLLEKSKIDHVFGVIIVLFASYKRAFMIDINEIQRVSDSGQKSLNIKKIAKWPLKYVEIKTIPNNRKKLLDYEGDINTYGQAIL